MVLGVFYGFSWFQVGFSFFRLRTPQNCIWPDDLVQAFLAVGRLLPSEVDDKETTVVIMVMILMTLMTLMKITVVLHSGDRQLSDRAVGSRSCQS